MVTNLNGRQLTRRARAPPNSRFSRGHAASPANAESHQITTLSNVRLIARLLLADFASEVVAIAAQPFLLRAPAGGRVRRHVPDFLLIHADQTVRVVNVKPAARLADPAVAEALAWPGELFEARGWGHEIWTGADPVLLANVRFLAGYRRPGIPPDAVTGAVLDLVRAGDCLGGLLDRLERGWPRPLAKAALLRLLWQRRVSTDLSRPLDAGGVLEVTR